MNDRLQQYEARRQHERKRKRDRKDRGDARAAYEAKVEGKPCRACGSGQVEGHHIVPKSRAPKSRTLNSRDNMMPLCHGCHQGHHTTAHRRIRRALLEPEELAFILRHAGEAWAAKWYPE